MGGLYDAATLRALMQTANTHSVQVFAALAALHQSAMVSVAPGVDTLPAPETGTLGRKGKTLGPPASVDVRATSPGAKEVFAA